MMEYAVLDWDNTVRDGFTLFSWIDYLLLNKVIDCEARNKIDKLKHKYAHGLINHDQYAELACSTYAASMEGCSDKIYKKMVDGYLHYDKTHFFGFTTTLFNTLSEYGIKVIIISGAPYYIIKRYKDQFKLFDIYAFCEESIDGFYTGRVSFNYGLKKEQTIKKLYKKYGKYPIIGIGDSSSDVPLFNYSMHGICIVSNMMLNNKFGPNINYVCNKSNEYSVRNLIVNLIHNRN